MFWKKIVRKRWILFITIQQFPSSIQVYQKNIPTFVIIQEDQRAVSNLSFTVKWMSDLSILTFLLLCWIPATSSPILQEVYIYSFSIHSFIVSLNYVIADFNYWHDLYTTKYVKRGNCFDGGGKWVKLTFECGYTCCIKIIETFQQVQGHNVWIVIAHLPTSSFDMLETMSKLATILSLNTHPSLIWERVPWGIVLCDF